MDHKKAVLYGIAIWAATFIAAMAIFPLWASERPLFESIMPVVLTLATISASYFYLKAVTKRFFMQGLCLGIVWLAVSIVFDSVMFSWGPMKMTLVNYIKDIGITYLIILIIPTGIGYLLEKKN